MEFGTVQLKTSTSGKEDNFKVYDLTERIERLRKTPDNNDPLMKVATAIPENMPKDESVGIAMSAIKDLVAYLDKEQPAVISGVGKASFYEGMRKYMLMVTQGERWLMLYREGRVPQIICATPCECPKCTKERANQLHVN